MTQRLFRTFPNFNFASMASARRHATAAPSTWPSESLRVSRERRGSSATVSVPQVNGIMMFIFGMQMMVQAQYNVRMLRPHRLEIAPETTQRRL